MRVIVFGADVADQQPTTANRPTSGWFRRAVLDPAGLEPTEPPFARRPDVDRGPGGVRAGWVLTVMSVVPALLATAWVVAGFPLAAAGLFDPAFVLPAFVVAAAILVPLGLALARRTAIELRGPWWSAAGTVAVAAGFTVCTALTHSSHVIVRRDAGSYAQIGYWLAHHGGLYYQVPIGVFGQSPGYLTFASPAFYQHDFTIVPQFMTGWPELLAGADWVGGWTGLLLTPTIIGGCAILAVGGLAARLIGPRWAPLAALLAAAAWPILRVSQETLSEPLALLMLAASTCLLIDLVLAGRRTGAGGADADDPVLLRRIQWHCFALGLVLTASELVRLDFGVDFAFVLPLLGWLWWTERPGVVSFLSGSVLGGGLGAWDAEHVTRIYVLANWSAVKPMLELLAAMAVAVVAGVLVVRTRGRSPRAFGWWRWVPASAAAVLAIVELGLFVRPWVLTDHSTTDPSVLAYVESLQHNLGLPIDGTRGYAEQSLRWVSWYLGWSMIVLAGVGAVVLTWRVLRGRDLRWLPALLVYLCSTLLVLIRPSITPDHPWADRRLVVEVLPCVILLALWTTAVLLRWIRGRWSIRWLPGAVLAAVLLSFLVPEGIALTPVAVERTEQGEPEMISRVCAVLPPDDVVIELDQVWMPVIRQQCGLPVAQLLGPTPLTINQVVRSIELAGGRPVIVGSQLDNPAAYGLVPRTTITLHTYEDNRLLLQRPNTTVPLELVFWLAQP